MTPDPEPDRDDPIDAVFRALADRTRRDIVLRVLTADQSVTELSERYAMSFAAVQKHVAVLERASLVTKHRAGREVRVRGNGDTVRRAAELLLELERIWRHRFDQIEALVATLDDDDPPQDPPKPHDLEDRDERT